MSKAKKYSYNEDLKIFSVLNPPVIIPALPFMQFFMKAFYYTDVRDRQVTKEKIFVPVKDGAKIRTLIYTPKNAEKKDSPAIVFYHGGGFVYNAAPHHFTLAKNLAKALGAKVFFVDYRLAPKYPFPTAVEDAYESYRYISENAEKFSIDKNRIALCGDSAGGNLAAVASIISRDEGFLMPCAQMLLYPFVDDDMKSESMLEFTDTPMCNSKAAADYNKAYVPYGYGNHREWFSAVDAQSHANLPAAYVETAEFDCLYDGGVKYYKKLSEAGVKSVLVETKGTMHGYDIATKSKVYAECMEKRAAFLKEAFER